MTRRRKYSSPEFKNRPRSDENLGLTLFLYLAVLKDVLLVL